MRSLSLSIGLCLGLLVTLIVSVGIDPAQTLARVTSGTMNGAEQANVVAARQDAEAHLGQLLLPPGATSSPGQPVGAGNRLESPAFTTGSPLQLVDVPGWWLVPGQPPEVLSWIEAHPPPGSIWKITSSDILKGVTESWSAGFEWPPISEVVGVRYLVVKVTADADGSTALRADGEDVWTVPHPASERIPQSARVLEVSRAIPGRAAKTIIVTRARIAHAVAALIDHLPIAQPGLMYCPTFNRPSTRFTLTFRATQSGPVLAQAVQSIPGRGCSGMGLTIRGHPQPALIGTAAVIREANALLQDRR